MSSRRTFVVAVVAGMIGALLVSMGPVAAQVGANLLMGDVNTVDQRTTLKGQVGSSNLRLLNSGAGVALELAVEPGSPPMKVNSNARVDQFNADRLDSRHANELIRVARSSSFDLDGDGNLTMEIQVPVAGYLIMEGNTRVQGTSQPGCLFTVDGTIAQESLRAIDLPPGGGSAICSTTTVRLVFGGTHTVVFAPTNTHLDVDFEQATAWVLYVPFGFNGAQPRPIFPPPGAFDGP